MLSQLNGQKSGPEIQPGGQGHQVKDGFCALISMIAAKEVIQEDAM